MSRKTFGRHKRNICFANNNNLNGEHKVRFAKRRDNYDNAIGNETLSFWWLPN